MDETVRIVQAWQAAANRQDVDSVLARSAPDIAIRGQRGVWRALATGEVIGEADIATWFRVAGGQVQPSARLLRCTAHLLRYALST